MLSTNSIITQMGKTTGKRLGKLQLVSRDCSAADHPYGVRYLRQEKKAKRKEKKQASYEVMFLGRVIQQKWSLGFSHPTLKTNWVLPAARARLDTAKDQHSLNESVMQISGRSSTHLMLQKSQPHSFKHTSVCLKTELQTVS